ncbi:MAG TPA: ester cyclase [Sporichthya sp.]|nr:ester cyclase [Sporichthya sp.]
MKSLARRYFEDLFNAGRLEVAEEILDPAISFAGPLHPEPLHGMEAFRGFAVGWYTGFPDRHFELLAEWVDPGRIACHFHIAGTHRGEFLGRPATGNTIDVRAMNVMTIEGGKIRAIEAYFNPVELLRAIGLDRTAAGEP